MLGVIGSGSWATAIVKILLEGKNAQVNWWVREPEIREGLERFGCNPRYLSGAEFDMSRLNVYEDINEVVEKSDDLFFVVPSAYAAGAFAQIRPELYEGRNWVTATKGLIAKYDMTITQYLNQKYNVSYDRLAVMSGPTHAEEVAQRKLSYLTVGSLNDRLIEHVRKIITGPFVTTAMSHDIEGIEYSAALKNVYAIAIGTAHGLGLGDNLIAVLVSSAVREMSKFLEHMAPSTDGKRHMTETVYLGDLLVTCYSQYSRNRMFGQMIGLGYTTKGAQLEMNMVAEGYYASECLEHLRDRIGITMPLLQAVYGVLYNNLPPRFMLRKIDQLL